MTAWCLMLRVAERFGLDPRTLGDMDDDEAACLMAYEQLRMAEEQERHRMIIESNIGGSLR